MSAHSATSPVLLAGLPRSASTWAFNVAAALLRHHDTRGALATLYSDGADGPEQEMLFRPGPVLVKTHSPSLGMACAAAWSRAPVILTVRDPRDCVLSLMVQFGFEFPAALQAVSSSASCLLRLARHCRPTVLRYEDEFASGAGIDAIAAALGLDVPEPLRAGLAASLSPDAVRQSIGRSAFTAVPGGLPVSRDDPQAQWHPNHVGDGRVGKFAAALAQGRIMAIEQEMADFMAAFGYAPAAIRAPLAARAGLDFCLGGSGQPYLGGGFSRPEAWGVWSCEDVAGLVLPLERPVGAWVALDLQLIPGPSFTVDGSTCAASVSVNGQPPVPIVVGASGPDRLRVALRMRDAGLASTRELQVRLHMTGLRSPAELGVNLDDRCLGLGLQTMSVDHG